jgi:hypothetical protein
VSAQLDAMQEAGPVVDLVQLFALPVPSLVICELLGVPYTDRADFQHRSAVLLDFTRTAEEQIANYAGMYAYMAELVTRLRAEPGESLLGEVISKHGDEVTDEELIGFGNLLLLAGHETTSNMIALGTLALLQNPEQLAAVHDDDEVTTPAVEELLRYLSIVSQIGRHATADVDVNGHDTPPGQTARLLRVDGREHENRHDPGGLRLVLGVVRPGRDGPLQPDRVLIAVYFPGLIVLLDRAVLQFHVRVGGHVVVPDGVLGRTAQRRDDGVLAVVLDAHHRRLAQFPRLGTHRRQHDHGLALVVGALGAAGALVEVDLAAAEVERARLVLPGKRHVSTIQSVD